MKKIVIIGGGLSGLSAADKILQQSKNTEVMVLQAMDRVGGRTLSAKFQGAYFDLGGTWIGPQQKFVQQLVKRSNNQYIPQHYQGTKIMDLQGVRSTYNSDIPYNVGILGLINLVWAMWKVDRMANTVPLDDPNKCQNAIQWDSLTVCTWLKNNIHIQKIRIMFEAVIRAIFGAQTNEISFLFFLWYVHQSNGLDNLVNIKNGNQEKKLMLGAQYLSNFLASQIEKKSGKIILNTFVSKIQAKNEKYIVQTTKGNKYQCDYIIIALPPANVCKIAFQPQLSIDRKFICQRNLLGSCSKALFLYDKPYWRQKGFSGEIISDCFDSAIFNTFDDSRTKENGQKQYAIVVFINGAPARYWMQRKDWAKSMTEKLAALFQSPEMLKPIKIEHKNWEIQSSVSGSPVAFFPPGALSQIKNLRKPQGKIHWAGTELATVSQGFMDGAIQSGIRVANEILDIMKSQMKQQQQKKEIINRQFWYTKFIKKSKKWIQWF